MGNKKKKEISLDAIVDIFRSHYGIDHHKNVVSIDENHIVKITTDNDCIEKFSDFFDDRAFRKPFNKYHLAIFVFNKKEKKIISNASLFLFEKEIFKSLYFWRYSSRPQFGLKKINLSDLMDSRSVKQILMLAYGQNFSTVDQKQYNLLRISIIREYMHFIKKLTKWCYDAKIPILAETTGRIFLESRIQAQKEVTGTDFNQNMADIVGKTRPSSKAVEDMARGLNMKELKYVFNLQSLGKVFMKLPCCDTDGIAV